MGGFDKGGVNSIAFSPDGRLLAEALSNRNVRLWDAQTRLWDVHTRRLLWTRDNHQCFSLAFSPVGGVLACAGKARGEDVGGNDYSISLCDVATGETRRCLTGHNLYVNFITFSRDGRLLASASDDSTVKLWELKGYDWFRDTVSQSTFSGHTDTVRSVSISPAGRMASSSRDDTVRVWDITTGRALNIQSQPDPRIVAYSPNGQMWAVNCESNDLSVFDVATGRLIHQLKQRNEIRAWCWSPDSSVLAVEVGVKSGQQTDLRGGLVLWHVESEVSIYTDEWPRGASITSYLNPMAISQDGRFLAMNLTDEGYGLHLWDISALGVGVGREVERERPKARVAATLSEPLREHLRSLPLSHALLQTPARPAQWLRGATSAGGRPPLCIVRDMGALLTQPRDQLTLARPAHLPPGLDTSAYLNLLTKLAAHPLLRELSGWDISESMAGVVIARLLAGLSFPEIYGLPGGVEAVDFAQRLGAELSAADMAAIWRETEPSQRPSLSQLLPTDALARIEANLRRLDMDELRFLHRYGPRLAGTPDPREMLDLFNLLDLPPAVRQALAQVLRLLPRVSQVMSKGGGMQTYAMGGYAGLTHKGSLDSLVPTELAYPSEMFLHRLLNQEALYYGRESEQERQREVAYIVTQAGLDVRGDVDVMARALTLALVEAMQGRGYEVQQSFVGSCWTQPAEMSKAADVQRVLYYRDEDVLRPRRMLSSVLGQLRAWRERYRGLHVIWVVGEHWDADDREENEDLYAALRAGANQQAWFVRLGRGVGRSLRPDEPIAARDFGRYQVVNSDLMWAREERPVVMYVAPTEDETKPAVEEKWVEPFVPPSRVMMITHSSTRYGSKAMDFIKSELRARGHTVMVDGSLTNKAAWEAALRDVRLVIPVVATQLADSLVEAQAATSEVITTGVWAAHCRHGRGRPRVLLVREDDSVGASDIPSMGFSAGETFTFGGPQDNDALLRAVIEALAPESSPHNDAWMRTITIEDLAPESSPSLRFDGAYATELECVDSTHPEKDWSWMAQCLKFNEDETFFHQMVWDLSDVGALAPSANAAHGTYTINDDAIEMTFRHPTGETICRGKFQGDVLHVSGTFAGQYSFHEAHATASGLRFDGVYTRDEMWMDEVHPERGGRDRYTFKFTPTGVYYYGAGVWGDEAPEIKQPSGSEISGNYSVRGTTVEVNFLRDDNSVLHFSGSIDGDTLTLSGSNGRKEYLFVHDRDIRA